MTGTGLQLSAGGDAPDRMGFVRRGGNLLGAMGVFPLLRRLGAGVGEAVFPFRCLACGALFRPPRPATGSPGGVPEPEGAAEMAAFFRQTCARFLCAPCAADVRPVTSPICPCCGIVFASRRGDDHLCGDCLTAPKHFDDARAFGVYDGSLMALIHQFKYRGKTRLGAGLGELLAAAFVRCFAGREPEVLAPVPLHGRRFRQRGFNQAHLLAVHLAGALRRGETGLQAGRLERELLRRRRPTRPQTGLGRRQRHANIRNAFQVSDPARVDGKRILLIDDVMTTGATVNECARVLKAGGAARVDILTLARGV